MPDGPVIEAGGNTMFTDLVAAQPEPDVVYDIMTVPTDAPAHTRPVEDTVATDEDELQAPPESGLVNVAHIVVQRSLTPVIAGGAA